MRRSIMDRETARRTRRAGLLATAAAGLLLLAACSGSSKPAQPAAQASASATTPAERVQAVLTPAAATPADTPMPAASATPGVATKAKGGNGGKYAGLLPQLNAQQLYAVLQKGKLPVSDGAAVTTANDPDGALGKPGEYTSRVDFLDTTLAQPGTSWTLANGGAIEVFASEKDAKAALKALDAANGSAPAEHDYLDSTVLLRLANGISATQQSAYGLAVKRAVHDDLKRQYKAASAVSPTPTPAPAQQ